MSSSTSSSETDPTAWRRFFRLAIGVAVAASALIYAFIVTVDPYDMLPFSPLFARWPIDSNARFSFPALARSDAFDSAVFGTSTSRLLRPVTLNAEFGARFANLAMNSATAYEQFRMLQLFVRHHPAPKVVMVGLDVEWCATGSSLHTFTDRPFPEWMYDEPYFRGYRESFNLDTLEKAGQAFAEETGLKPEVYGHDGYTSFVPDDRLYDHARVAMHLKEAAGEINETDPVSGDPHAWLFPALDTLRNALAIVPAGTRKILYFVPYNHVLLPNSGNIAADYAECKRRVTTLAANVPGLTVVDFMRLSPITTDDDNFWDARHYRVGIAERLARDLAAASRGEISAEGDYALLVAGGQETARR
jgi:hypothetical protein